MIALTKTRRNIATLNPADWISLYRIVALPFLVLAIVAETKFLFAFLLGCSLLSDIIDGWIARRTNTCSSRGARLDSIGDALTFAVAIAGLFVFETDFLRGNTWLILTAVIPYTLQILLAVLLFGKPTSYHTYLAKLAALLQGSFILLLLFYKSITWLLILTVVVTVTEIAEEFVLMYMVGGHAINVKGLYWVLKEKINQVGHQAGI